MIIQDVVFKNFTGVASTKHDPKVGTLVCSSAAVSTFYARPRDIGTNPSIVMHKYLSPQYQHHHTERKDGKMDLYKCRRKFVGYQLCLGICKSWVEWDVSLDGNIVAFKCHHDADCGFLFVSMNR